MQAVITSIHFVAFSTSTTDAFLPPGCKPTNHWPIFLGLEDGTGIDLNMQPGGDMVTGCIVLGKSGSSAYKEHEIKVVSSPVVPQIEAESIPVTKNVTVGTILQLILTKKRASYRFTPSGEGCRFWCLTFARDLKDAGVFSEDVYAALGVVVPRFWKSALDTEGEERLVDEGTFV